MYGKIIKEWDAQVRALESAAKLNSGPVAERLAAQAEAYGLARRTVTENFDTAIEVLGSAVETFKDAAGYLPNKSEYLTTITQTLKVCISGISRDTPQEVEQHASNHAQ